MRSIDVLPYALPFFALFMLIEIIWARRMRRHEYRYNDSATCIILGFISFFIGVLGAGLKIYCYIFLYEHYRFTEMFTFSLALQITLFVTLIVAQDFAYYWFHRMAHRVNLLWGAHIVHHSSEEYNLAVAVRQSSFQQFFAWPFYLPLALIGYPPEWLVAVISLNLIYQFWFHTREIDLMPAWFEAVFNTPSHHRVHHGTNKQYLDKNYGGIFIVWDRWFGTFEPEVEPVRYGITVPVESFNPVWINVHYYWYLWQTSSAAPNFNLALWLWLAPPDWVPNWVPSKDDKAINSPTTL